MFLITLPRLNGYASCLRLHRRDIKAQTELTGTDVTCLSLRSGGIGASAGHRSGCLDQRPGSPLNPITHPRGRKRCASERRSGRELGSSTLAKHHNANVSDADGLKDEWHRFPSNEAGRSCRAPFWSWAQSSLRHFRCYVSALLLFPFTCHFQIEPCRHPLTWFHSVRLKANR